MKNSIACLLLFSASIAFSVEKDVAKTVDAQNFYTIGTVCPKYRSVLGSVVSGRIETVFVEIGDRVKEGQPLVQLDPRLFTIAVAEAEGAVRSARLELHDAAKNYERMKTLFEHPSGPSPVISQKRLEDAQMRFEQASVQISRAEETYNRAAEQLKETTIVAPYEGVITKRFVHPGEPVTATPATKLLELVSDQICYVEFAVPQTHGHRLRVGAVVSIRIEGATAGDISAPIDLIFPDVDEKTRSIKCRATLASSAVRPGALVRITLPITEGSYAAL